jgi:hypothetical protein
MALVMTWAIDRSVMICATNGSNRKGYVLFAFAAKDVLADSAKAADGIVRLCAER